MSRSHRPNLSTNLPPGARSPAIPSPVDSWNPYLNTPDTQNQTKFRPYAEVDNSRLFVPPHTSSKHRPSRSASGSSFDNSFESFNHSQQPLQDQNPVNPHISPRMHRHAKSEAPSVMSRRESLDYTFETGSSFSHSSTNTLSEELSNMSLDTEDSLHKFQAGLLAPKDEEWHFLVPTEAREALGKREVERQSVIFEIFKSERDYLGDLQLIREVFIDGLRSCQPPVMAKQRLPGFVREVFWNIEEITTHHRRMLEELFKRQREQHPVVLSISDIILDTCLYFRDNYESYIKHYPLAEARHRAELQRNRDYQYFMVQAGQDPRVRKHDLATFLNRPVTRLPRLALVLEHLLKLSDSDHVDHESLPLTLSILSDFIKSTQPGIEAADLKARFWEFAESLVFVKGEIIDMDLYDDKRTLVYAGPLARRDSEWGGWTDHYVALLDNFLVLTREESRGKDTIKRHVASRPIPLEYLRLSQSHAAPQIRRERSENAGLLSSFRSDSKPTYPITFWHAANPTNRRYTLYTVSEGVRKKWENAMVDAISVRKAFHEANMWFAPHVVNTGFFQHPGLSVPERDRLQYTGKVVSGTSFVIDGQSFIVIGTLFGVFVAHKAMPVYQKVLSIMNPISLAAIPHFDALIIHERHSLHVCSLSALARFTRAGSSASGIVDKTLQRITKPDEHVLFARVGEVGNRSLLFYAIKSRMQVTIQTLEMVDPHTNFNTRRESAQQSAFRPFGQGVSVPKDVHSLITLSKSVAIAGEKGMLVVDPTQLSRVPSTMVPDFRNASSSPAMSALKSRCDSSRPLGIIKCDGGTELMVIYEDLGCFADKHGVPSRHSGFIRWEAKVDAFAHRGRHLLLFSAAFVEIREVSTGRLVQVIEDGDIRLLQPSGWAHSTEGILLAMRTSNQQNAPVHVDRLVELLPTAEISQSNTDQGIRAELFREWDMTF